MKPFFIFSLPRSGTAWLSNFLTWGNAFCFHEVSYGCGSMEEIRDAFLRTECPVVGACDTAASVYAHAIEGTFPNARFVIVLRDPREAHDSLVSIGASGESIPACSENLSWVASHMDCLTIPFERLFSQHALREIWEHVRMPDPFPWRRFEMLREYRIEDIERFVCYSDEQMNQQREAIGRFEKMVEALPRRFAEQEARA